MAGTVMMAKVIVSSPDEEKKLAALRTRLAARFVTLAEKVTEAFEDFHIGAGSWVVELTTPEEMSTGGGKRALQHFRLRPRRRGFSTVIGGSVNPVTRVAELKDYDHIAMVHQVRFGTEVALAISPEEWEQFLRQAEVVLESAGIEAHRMGPPRELLAKAKPRTSPALLGAFVLVSMLALAMVWRVYVALGRT